MTEQPTPVADEAPDLEYDLAHEASEPAHAQEAKPSVYVATHTEAYDGDYGYDMAHDVPGR